MINISEHGAYMQNVLDITSDLFDLTTTIVDRNYLRIAGTHHYRSHVGKPVENPNVFRHAIEHGKSILIEDPRENELCLDCQNKDKCFSLAAIYAPLQIKNAIVGGLGIIAYTPEQRKHIVNNTRFFQFAEQLSDLLACKIEAEQSALKLESSLNKNIAILNAVHDGVIAIDYRGIIEQANHSALTFLGVKPREVIGSPISQFLPQTIIEKIIEENISFIDHETEIIVKNKNFPVFLTSQKVNKRSSSEGIVLSFKSVQEVGSLARIYTASGTKPITFENIIGKSNSIRSVKILSEKVSAGDSTVLIRGESGTGKELFARAIHNKSLRSNGPFIAVNCAAIPEPLLESELFGYVEGAFTGARRGGKPGKCELAAGGTLFLDEVGDIPLFLQSKFLRMLQERTIERVGGNKTIPIDVRIIAATNRDLETMIECKEFREDLYYRLNVIPIALPPLEERKEDIYSLCIHFLAKYSARLNKQISNISQDTIKILKNYHWPGNIRELENTIEYAVNMENSEVLTPSSLPSRISHTMTKFELSNNKSFKINDTLRNLEIKEIVSTINTFGWSTEGKKNAAKHLGISLATLYRKLKKLQINHPYK